MYECGKQNDKMMKILPKMIITVIFRIVIVILINFDENFRKTNKKYINTVGTPHSNN